MNRADKSAKPAPRGQQPPRAPQQGAPQIQKGTKDCRRSSCPKTRLNNDTRGTQKESAPELKSVGKGNRAGSVVESVSNDECPKSASVQRKLSDDSNASEDYSKDSGCVSWKLSSSDSSSEMSDCTSEGNKPDPPNIDPEISWLDGSASAKHGGGRGDEKESKDGDTVGNDPPDLGGSLGVAYVSENYSTLMMGETTEGLIREVDDLRSENEYLKDEMEELHCEMVEMRDMFQEEEVYQLQELRLQLEQANKTCRILQYRLRKAERRSIRVAQTGQVDGELVRSLEHDIKVAKSVSLRLRNELESVQKKKSLLDVENEALRERTQELEVAKQVLQTEVDKVFSKENSLKRRSVRSPISKAERRLSQLIEEDSADLKCQLHFAKEELALMCKKLTKLVSESEGMRVELARYHSAYGDVDPNQFPEGKANYARSRETEVKAHLKLVEEEATLLSRRIVELEVENRGLRSEMSDMRDKCGGVNEEEEEEPIEVMSEKLVPQVDLEWELKARGQSGTMGRKTEYTQDNKANGTTDTGVAESSILRDGSPAQTKGMLSVCQITREGPVGGEWSPLVQEEVSGREEDRGLHGKTVKDCETLLSLKEHACIVSSAIQLLTSPSNGLASTPVAMPETGFQKKGKAQPPGQSSFIQGPVNESLALLQNMLLAFIGHLEKLLTDSELGRLSFQKDAHVCDSYMFPFILGEFAGHNMDAQNVTEHDMMEEVCTTDIKERGKHTQQGPSSQLNTMQSPRDPKVLLILQAMSVLHRWAQVKEAGLADNEARAKTIDMLQKLLHELEAECPDSLTARDSEPMAVRCKTNEDASACAISNERRYFEIDRTYKAEGKRSRRPYAPCKSNRKHWFYLSQSVAQLDQEDPVKTWDHPIMPRNFPDLDFEQISTERSHTAPESTTIRIYYSPPSARRVRLAQLRQSPATDRESVAVVSSWCPLRSPLSPLYLGLSANLSDDMKEMTASWRRVAHSSHPEEERRRSSGAWVEVACSGTQTKTQPQMVSVALQTDGPQGVASVRNSPSRVQSPSSARALHNSTSAERVNGRAARPRQTSPKLYRRHSSSFLPSTTFSSSSSLASSSSSSTPSRERALVNLSNQGPARTTWARPAHNKASAGHISSTLNTDFGSPSRAAKPPSKAAGNHRYGLVTEFLRKVSGRAEKPAPGAGPKGKSDLKNLERIPTRPPAVALHRNDSVTRIVNKRFMKQGEEKGSSQNMATKGAIARDGSSSSVTAEEGNYDCSSGSTLTFCFARPQRQTLNAGKPQ